MWEEYKKLREHGYTIRGLCQAARKGIRFPEPNSDKILTPEETLQMLKGVITDDTEEEIVEFFNKMEYGDTKCWLCSEMFKQEPGGFRNSCDECDAKASKIWEELGDISDLTEEEQVRMGIFVKLMTHLDKRP